MASNRKLKKQLRTLKTEVRQCRADITEMRTAMAGAGAVLNLDNRPGPGHCPART